MRGKYLLFVAAWVAVSVAAEPGVLAQAPPETFTPGHIFISVHDSEGCRFGTEAIIEIDPTTGAWSVFADSNDGICSVNGLRFTPDGGRLFALNADPVSHTEAGSVRAFNPDGTSEVILDRADGLFGPFGANALAFDFFRDLYVLNSLNSTIMRFPESTGPGIVFADFNDGILGRGALDFAPNGDLFYAGDGADAVIRITPQGDASVFDTVSNPGSLAFDRSGNLFVAAGGGTIYRYDNGDAGSRRVLASGFVSFGSLLPIIVSPDGTVVYFAETFGTLYAINAEDGTTSVLTDWSDLGFLGARGMTVYDPPPRPPPPGIPTVSAWGMTVLALVLVTLGSIMVRRHSVTKTQFNARVADPDGVDRRHERGKP